MFLSIFLLFIIIFVVDKCTVINLSPKLLFKRAAYKQFPELQDGLKWGRFSLYRVTQTNNVKIRYFPKKNFFLVSDFKGLGNFNPVKIDSVGNKVFELNLNEKHPFKFLEAINCFAIGADGIYDLSADDPVAMPFIEVLNRNKDIAPEQWIEIFEKMYQSADTVLYVWHSDIQSAQSVLFRIDDKWTKLYDYKFIYTGGSKTNCEINRKIIPQKWQEEHFLKDVENATYSNQHRFTDSYITPYNSDHSFFPDQQLEYPVAGELKTLAFSKEMYTQEGYMNPGIPSAFYGTGYYELNIDNDILHFKTVASRRNSIGEAVQTDLHLFGLPLAFAKKTTVRFLTYDYGINVHENGKKGVYVIKKKFEPQR